MRRNKGVHRRIDNKRRGRVARRVACVAVAVAACVALAVALSTSAFGETKTYTPSQADANGWQLTYTLDTETQTAKLTGYTQAGSSTLVVPETVESDGVTYTVTAVGDGPVTKYSPPKVPRSAFYDTGVTKVVLPDTVTTIGTSAFAQCTSLESVVLPSGLTSMGNYVFMGDTALTSVTVAGDASGVNTLPVGVQTVPQYAFGQTALTSFVVPASVRTVGLAAFMECAKLSDVQFAGETMETIGGMAFYGCVSLEKIEIPQLTSLIKGFTPTVSGGNNYWTFYGCTGLKTVIFHTTSDNYELGGTKYFYSIGRDYMQGCTSIEYVVWEGKKGSTTSWNQDFLPEGSQYCTLYVFGSQADAQEGDLTKARAKLQYQAGTNLSQILAGTADASKAYGDVPDMAALSQELLGEGYSWSIPDLEFYDEESTLSNSYFAYPSLHDHLDEGSYLSSPEIDIATNEDWGSSTDKPASSMSSAAHYYVNLDGAGVSNINDIVAKSSTGYTVNTAYYTLVFEQRGTYHPEWQTGMTSSADTYEWDKMSGVPTSEGMYRVYALSTEANGSTVATDYKYISVEKYTPTVLHNGSSAIAESYSDPLAGANSESLAATTAGIRSLASSYSLVASASNWQSILVAMGAASAGNGNVAFVDGDEGVSSARTVSVATNADVVNLVAVGSQKDVSDDVLDQIKESSTVFKDGSLERICARDKDGEELDATDKAATVQALALDGYDLVASYGSKFSPAATLPSTAVLCSPSASHDILPVMQLIREIGATVLFTEDDGSLSDDTLDALESFDRILVAGDSSYVPTSVVVTVQNAFPEAEVARVMTEGDAYHNSLSLVGLLEKYGASLDDTSTSRYAHLHIALASDVACVAAACEYAAVDGGLAVTVSSASELHELAATLKDLFDNANGSLVQDVDFVGSINDTDAESTLLSVWQDYDNAQTALGAGDSIESSGSMYAILAGTDGSLYAEWTKLADSGVLTAQILNSVSGITVSSPYYLSVLSGASYLKTLSVARGVSLYGINQSFFSGVPSLVYVYVSDVDQEDALQDMSLGDIQVYIHDSHKLVDQAATAATCTTAGNIEYWQCSICGEDFQDADGVFETDDAEVRLAALGHDMVSYPALAATSTEAGYTAYSQCSRCGYQNPEPIVIPATGSASSDSGGTTSGSTQTVTTTITTTTVGSTTGTTSTSSTGTSSSSATDSSASGTDGTSATTSSTNAVTNAGNNYDSSVSADMLAQQFQSQYDAIFVREVIVGIVAFVLLGAGIVAFRRYRRRDPVTKNLIAKQQQAAAEKQ